MHRLLIGLLALFAATSAHAIDRFVATTGADVGDCSNNAAPCLTLQYAINQAVANDTIVVAAGTYSVAGSVTVNKTLTLTGAQAGVDARNRVATESILSHTGSLLVTASNVVIDGFTIQDNTNAAAFGFGVVLQAGVDGTQFRNNIVQNNISGLALANTGTTQAVIFQNHFRNNNQPGPASGHGIYADQFSAGGAVSNVLIDSNAFDDNDSSGIGFSHTTAPLNSNISIVNNTFDSNGRALYAFYSTAITIQNNSITNSTLAGSAAIRIFSGVTGMSILDNDIQGGFFGIRVTDVLGGDPSSGIEAHQNNITGFSQAGLQNDDVASVNATCNWWGAASGPTNASNPGGTGEVVIGPAAFDPWLIAPAPGGLCGVHVVPAPVPTQSPWAILLMMLALGAIGYATLRRSRG